MTAATIPLLATYDVIVRTGREPRILAEGVTGDEANEVAWEYPGSEIVRHPDYVSAAACPGDDQAGGL